MANDQEILALWKRARQHGETVFLATVIHVEGSSYRKPGARMLVTASGERAGMVSGGCLEAEVCKKIAWLTRAGTCLQSYKSSFDDDQEGVPYGLGCGGTIWLMMEPDEQASRVLEALEDAIDRRLASVIVYALQDQPGAATIFHGSGLSQSRSLLKDRNLPCSSSADAVLALNLRKSIASKLRAEGTLPDFIYVPLLPLPRLLIFGAGDDVRPIVRFAAELGWDIQVADGRAHLVRCERFPEARELKVLEYAMSSGMMRSPRLSLTTQLEVRPDDFAIILTHSYDQDGALLQALLPLKLRYLGILGPLHRTERLVSSIAPSLFLSEESCMERLHAPIGLDLGAGEPSSIALAIITEIQAELLERRVRVTQTNSVERPDHPFVDEPHAFEASSAAGGSSVIVNLH